MYNIDFKNIIIYLIIGILIGYLGRGLIGQGFDDGWKAAREKVNQGIVTEDDQASLSSISGIISQVDKNSFILNIPPLSPLDDKELSSRTVKVSKKIIITAKRSKTSKELLGSEYSEVIDKLESKLSSLRRDDFVNSSDIKKEMETITEEAINSQKSLLQDLSKQLRQLDQDSKEYQNVKAQIEEMNSPFIYKTVDFSYLKVGQRIKVIADKDISQSKKIIASTIEIEE